jgi:hypothetical protein
MPWGDERHIDMMLARQVEYGLKRRNNEQFIN